MSKITIQRDICLNLVIPLTATHDFIPLPPFPPVPPPLPAAPLSLAACAIESPVNAWWPPGYALGANKFTTTVFHGGMLICLDGHDCGKFIPHVQVAPAPNNTLTIPQIALSTRKANFSASTVKMNGKPAACMTLIGWPPTPMTYCSNPISMPLADAPTSHLNSVTVGMTFADWFAGVFAIAVNMILEYVMFKRGGGTKAFGQSAGKMIASNKAGKSVASLLASKFIGQIKPKSWKDWGIKQAVGALVGAVRIAATGEGSIGVSLPIGGPFLGLTGAGSVTFSNRAPSGWSAGVTGNAGTASGNVDVGNTGVGAGLTSRHPLGLGQESATYKTDKGLTTTDTDISDPFGGFHNRTVTDTPTGTQVADSRAPTTLPNSL